MPTLNSVTKTARITGSDWEVIERYMNEQEITFSGLVKEFSEKIRNPQGVHPQNTDLSRYGITTDIIAELAQIVKLCGGDLKDVLNDMGERLNSGELTIDGGQLVIDDEIDLTRLREIAERYHKEPQEVLNGLLERAIG